MSFVDKYESLKDKINWSNNCEEGDEDHGFDENDDIDDELSNEKTNFDSPVNEENKVDEDKIEGKYDQTESTSLEEPEDESYDENGSDECPLPSGNLIEISGQGNQPLQYPATYDELPLVNLQCCNTIKVRTVLLTLSRILLNFIGTKHVANSDHFRTGSIHHVVPRNFLTPFTPSNGRPNILLQCLAFIGEIEKTGMQMRGSNNNNALTKRFRASKGGMLIRLQVNDVKIHCLLNSYILAKILLYASRSNQIVTDIIHYLVYYTKFCSDDWSIDQSKAGALCTEKYQSTEHRTSPRVPDLVNRMGCLHLGPSCTYETTYRFCTIRQNDGSVVHLSMTSFLETAKQNTPLHQKCELGICNIRCTDKNNTKKTKELTFPRRIRRIKYMKHCKKLKAMDKVTMQETEDVSSNHELKHPLSLQLQNRNNAFKFQSPVSLSVFKLAANKITIRDFHSNHGLTRQAGEQRKKTETAQKQNNRHCEMHYPSACNCLHFGRIENVDDTSYTYSGNNLKPVAFEGQHAILCSTSPYKEETEVLSIPLQATTDQDATWAICPSSNKRKDHCIFDNKIPYKKCINLPTDGATIDGVTIYNTCCLDGFLVMVFLTLKYNDTIRLRMQDSGDELDKIFYFIWKKFQDGDFDEGKFRWCRLGEMIPSNCSSINLKGSEYQRIYSVLGRKRMEFEILCTQSSFRLITMNDHYRHINIYIQNGETLSSAIQREIVGYLEQNLGRCNLVHGPLCNGKKIKRLLEPPFFLPLSLYFVQEKHYSSDLPDVVVAAGIRYKLKMVRFYLERRCHFVEKLDVDDKWAYYDNKDGHLFYFDRDPVDSKLSSCFFVRLD